MTARGAAITVFLTGAVMSAVAVLSRFDENEAPATVIVLDKPFTVSVQTPKADEPSPPENKTEDEVPPPESEKKDEVPPPPPEPPAAAEKPPEISEREATVSLTPRICEKLSLSAVMNGPDYVPGVDVDGNPVVSADYSPEAGVAPADLPSNDAFGIEKTIKEGVNDMAFTVNLRLEGVYSDDAFLKSSPVPLVRVAVKNGEVYFNGVPAVKADAEKIRRACVSGSSIPAKSRDSF